jgi:outer membrane protein TolC
MKTESKKTSLFTTCSSRLRFLKNLLPTANRRLSTALFFLCVSAAGAQTVTLEDSIRSAWENSPLLSAQKTQVQLANDDTWRRYLPQEPVLQYNNYYSNTYYSYGLAITYPLPFKSMALGRVDHAVAQQQRWELTAKKEDLAQMVAQAYMNCATAQAMIVFQSKNVQDLETITEAIRLQYIHGQANQTEKITAELTLTQAERDLRTAQDQLKTAVQLYDKLLNITTDKVPDFDLPEDVPPSVIKELGAYDNRNNSQLRDQASVNVAEANRSASWWNEVPDVTFTITPDWYTDVLASPTGYTTDWNFGISLTLPIFFPFEEAADAQRNESSNVIAKEQARLQLLQDNSAHDDAIRDYSRSKARFKQLQTRDLLLAKTMLDSALEAYKRGNLQFAVLMLARQTYASLKTEDIQIRSEIVNAHLLCLGDAPTQEELDKQMAVTGSSGPASQEGSIPTSSAPSTVMTAPMTTEKATPTPVARHRLGAKDIPLKTPVSQPVTTPTPAPETGSMPQTDAGSQPDVKQW